MTKKRITRKRVGKYSNAIKEQAAIEYAICGSVNKVAKDMTIPNQTISEWKKTDWWDDLIGKVRAEKAEQHIATYTRIVDAAQKVVLDKIDESTASQASLIACQAQDKGLLLQGRPTSITAKQDNVEAMAARFRLIAQDIKDNTIPVNLIDVTPKDKG